MYLLKSERTVWIDCLILTVVFTILYFSLISFRPLFVPDEGRYAEIAREMIARSDFVTPYLNDIKYFEKPVLFYWLAVGAIKTFGLNFFALRSVNALLALLGCLLTYLCISQLYNRRTGFFAAITLGTSLLYFVMAQMVSLDLTVSVFIAGTLYAFLLAATTSVTARQRWFFYAAAASAGLAVLTKGLIGIVFPVAIGALWMLLARQWRLLRQAPLLKMIAIFLLIVAPWHLLVGYRNPGFFYFYFIEQHFLRYATKEIGHYQPVWFFIPYLFCGFFPWICFLPQALTHAVRRIRQEERGRIDLFFLIWFSFIFLFFSFSKSKLIPYILPSIPPLAVFTAQYLDECLEQQRYRGINLGYLLLALASIAVLCLLFALPHIVSIPKPTLASQYLSLAALCLLFGTVSGGYLAFKYQHTFLSVFLGTTFLFLFLLMAAFPTLDNRTIFPLAKHLKRVLKPSDEVMALNQYYQDLPFYLERRITVLNWRNELTYGMTYQNTSAWMIDFLEFEERWTGEKRIFAMIDKEKYKGLQERFPLLNFYQFDENMNNMVISNRPILYLRRSQKIAS